MGSRPQRVTDGGRPSASSVLPMSAMTDLADLLGADRVLHHPLDLIVFAKDAGVTSGTVLAAVFPESTEEVSAIVRIAFTHGVPIVPRGAGTGLAGGAVAVDPGILIVMTRMDALRRIDEVGRTAWVGPGVINLDLSKRLAPLGLHFASDRA